MSIHDAIPKLRLLLPRLSSDSDGEIVATVSAIRRTLKSNGCDLHDLTARLTGEQQNTAGRQEKPRTQRQQHQRHDFYDTKPETDWEEVLAFCLQRADRLGERERQFVNDMESNLQEWGSPTERQGAWLLKIFGRLGGVQ